MSTVVLEKQQVPKNEGENTDFEQLVNRPKYNGELMTGQTNIPDLAPAITEEETARKAADSAIEEKLNTEILERTNNVSTLTGRIDNLDTSLAQEIEARESGDATNHNDIVTEANTRSANDTNIEAKINSEIEAREQADATLQAGIKANADKLVLLNTAIDDESASRISGDDTLQDTINFEAEERQAADAGLAEDIADLQSQITSEVANRTAADTHIVDDIIGAVEDRVTAIEGLDAKLTATSVIKDITYSEDASNITITEHKINLGSETETTETETLPVASSTAAGIINAATYNSITNSQEQLDALLGGAIAVSNLPANPSQALLTSTWKTQTGKTELINRASIYDKANGLIHTYYTNTGTWEDSPAGARVDVYQFTNDAAGIIKGSTADGQVFAESDGTGSVNGWDARGTRLTNVESAASANATAISGLQTTVSGKANKSYVDTELGKKQNTLTAGTNITISGNTISSKDTVYTLPTASATTLGGIKVGNNLTIENGILSANNQSITVDSALSSTSTNPVQNKVINSALAGKAESSSIPTKTSQLTNDSNFAVDTNYVHTDNNYTSTEKTKLSGIASGAEVNVQSDWNTTDTNADSYIKNKPALKTVATTGSYTDLTNKPTIPAAQVNSDWNATSGKAQILNKPTIPDVSGKLDKITSGSTDKVYAHNGTTQKEVTYTASATASTIAYRDTNGNVSVATPTADAHAATKKYVDNKKADLDWSTLVAPTAETVTTGMGATYTKFNKCQNSIRSVFAGHGFDFSGRLDLGGSSGAATINKTAVPGLSGTYGFKTNCQVPITPSAAMKFSSAGFSWRYTPGSDPGARLMSHNIFENFAVGTDGYIYLSADTSSSVSIGSWERMHFIFPGGVRMVDK